MAGTRTTERYRNRRKQGLCGQCGHVRTGIRARCDRCNAMLRSYKKPRTAEQKAANAARLRKWYAADPNNGRNARLMRKYGMSLAEYTALWERQGGVCAICGKGPSAARREKWLSVDHDHKTGKVRGLLCNHCNSALGYIIDSPETAHKIIAYLS